MTAPAGAEVGLYVDLCARVHVGDLIETQTGRRYFVVGVRLQMRGKAKGRQHLRAIVLGDDDRDTAGMISGSAIHKIRWYKRTSPKVGRPPYFERTGGPR